VLRYFEPQFYVIATQLLEKITHHLWRPQLIVFMLRMMQYVPNALIANFQPLALFQQSTGLIYPLRKFGQVNCTIILGAGNNTCRLEKVICSFRTSALLFVQLSGLFVSRPIGLRNYIHKEFGIRSDKAMEDL
jgi:hypothetical protein